MEERISSNVLAQHVGLKITLQLYFNKKINLKKLKKKLLLK